jgi:hypothetical protein
MFFVETQSQSQEIGKIIQALMAPQAGGMASSSLSGLVQVQEASVQRFAVPQRSFQEQQMQVGEIIAALTQNFNYGW